MFKHLPGRHSQASHGKSVIEQFVENYSSPILGKANLVYNLDRQGDATVTFTKSTAKIKLGLVNMHVVFEDGDRNFEEVMSTAEDIGKQLRLGMISAKLAHPDNIVFAARHGYEMSKVDVTNAIYQYDLVQPTEGKFNAVFDKEFVTAYLKRSNTNVVPTGLYTKLQEMKDDFKKAFNMMPIKDLNIYGQACLRHALDKHFRVAVIKSLR